MNKKFTNIGFYFILGIISLVILAGVMGAIKAFNNVTTPIHVTEVEAGVKCASMVTADGAAISCWKVDE